MTIYTTTALAVDVNWVNPNNTPKDMTGATHVALAAAKPTFAANAPALTQAVAGVVTPVNAALGQFRVQFPVGAMVAPRTECQFSATIGAETQVEGISLTVSQGIEAP